MGDSTVKLYRVGLLRPNQPESRYFTYSREEAERQVADLRELMDLYGWGKGNEIKMDVLECKVIESTSYTG